MLSSIQIVRPGQGGYLRSECPPSGERIAEGAVLGRGVSPYTFKELEVIRNPVPNGWMVLAYLIHNLVEAGGYSYMAGGED